MFQLGIDWLIPMSCSLERVLCILLYDSAGVLGLAYRGVTDGFLLLQIFSVGISVSPHVCFVLDLILISMFLR